MGVRHRIGEPDEAELEQVLVAVEVELGIGKVVAGQALGVELQQGIGEVEVGIGEMEQVLVEVEIKQGIGEVAVGQVVVLAEVKHVVVEMTVL